MKARQWLANVSGRILIGATLSVTLAASGCTTYRVRAPTTPAPSALIGRTIQFVYAADSLTLKVNRVEGTSLFGRVADGSGPAAIQLSDVRAARMEELNAEGHPQELQMKQVRGNPSVLEGASVWFETRHGNVVLRGIHVRPDGWIEGRVVSNNPAATSIASSTRVKVRSDALVRIDLGSADSYGIRTVDPVETGTKSAGFLVLLLVGLVAAVALLVGTGLDMER